MKAKTTSEAKGDSPVADSCQLHEYVEAFERSRADDPQTDFRDFLPHAESPEFVGVATELVRVDMEYSWSGTSEPLQTGRRLAHYQHLLPKLFSNQSALSDVAFEEYRLRVHTGDDVSPAFYQREFGVETEQWPQVERRNSESTSVNGQMAASESTWQDALTLATNVQNFPEVGQDFLGFKLQGELGQGAFARVFMATQSELADRPVVLKIAAGKSLEPEHLARLQHTNIVPIYSVHRQDHFTAACMPLLGTRTLADLILAVQNGDPRSIGEQNLISTFLNRRDDTVVSQSQFDSDQSIETNASQVVVVEAVAKASYVNAVIWIVQQLAQGLAHAHGRGIVHRDLKPANILLTDEGVPLVLDFNLSEDVVVHGPGILSVGGTLPYMSPEQLVAVHRGGRLGPQTDVYSLGVILFELLCGSRPFPDRRGAFDDITENARQDRIAGCTPVHELNAAVPHSISAVVSHCLATSPSDRYQSMTELADDLRRHLEDRPLRYAPNRSLAERFRKWTRRHPRLSSGTSVAILFGVALLVLASLLIARGRQAAQIEAEVEFQKFSESMPSLYMAVGVPHSETELLANGISQARAELNRYGVFTDQNWKHHQRYTALPPLLQDQLDQRVGNSLYLLANASIKLAERRTDNAESLKLIEQGQRFNQLALKTLKPAEPAALLDQQASLIKLAGSDDEGIAVRENFAAAGSSEPLNPFVEVVRLHEAGDYHGAIPLLTALRDANPHDPAPWLFLGNSKVAQRDLHDAEGHYTTAIAIQPDSYLGYFYRGLCRLDLQEYQEADGDFSQVIDMKPTLACGYLNRALALRGLNRHADAVSDLTKALELGATQTRIYFLRSQLRARMGDHSGAKEDRELGLSATPSDELSWVARGVALLESDPKAALADFQRALQLNPLSVSALRNCVHVLADKLDRPDEAMASLDQLLLQNHRDPDALAGRAVLFARQGDREQAIADVQALLKLSKEPKALFQAACALSITSTTEEKDAYKALTLLSRAVTANPTWSYRAQTDPDLVNLRKTEEFKALIESIKEFTRLNFELHQRSREAPSSTLKTEPGK
ncbi:serine/threonine-protein kinase [Adhaeretor mobilis]|uniref:Serine/threonine-protein kinase PrkC n=1 Tax=Adhaeretor mobilis TaxID=1930276 RepID=A0A517MS12_9BACT|nr:serine/threonine-protein kinase [Adhaeretor mobilis]QDS97669.1 Serine/threonine-protein kinase PrkC [Adhaeretor mobilis]